MPRFWSFVGGWFLKLWIRRSQNKKNKFHLHVIELTHSAQVSINFKGAKQ